MKSDIGAKMLICIDKLTVKSIVTETFIEWFLFDLIFCSLGGRDGVVVYFLAFHLWDHGRILQGNYVDSVFSPYLAVWVSLWNNWGFPPAS